jgi:hypothetical protein
MRVNMYVHTYVSRGRGFFKALFLIRLIKIMMSYSLEGAFYDSVSRYKFPAKVSKDYFFNTHFCSLWLCAIWMIKCTFLFSRCPIWEKTQAYLEVNNDFKKWKRVKSVLRHQKQVISNQGDPMILWKKSPKMYVAQPSFVYFDT